MARLIDADELKRYLLEEMNFYPALVEKAIDEQPTVKQCNSNEWISVKDKLPKEEDDVLVLIREIEHYGRHKEKRNVYHWIYTGWFVDGVWATTYCHGYRKIETENEEYPNCEHTVTHWMPLPELRRREE